MSEAMPMQTSTANVPADNTSSEVQQEQLTRAKEHGTKVTIRTIVVIGAIVVGILLVLFVVSRAALYTSIPDMLGDMGSALAEVIRRIFS